MSEFKHIRLRRGDRKNFNTLRSAADNGDLALVSSRRKSDGANVALVCAMSRTPGSEDITAVPLAVMVEGNPYELFEAPFPSEAT